MQASEFLSTTYLSLMSASAGGAGITVDFDGSVLIQFVIFLLLFILLKPILLDPFLNMMEERERRTDGAKNEARSMDERAATIVERYEAELEKVRAVADQERERIRTDAQKLEAQIFSVARDDASRVAAEGKQKIQTEVQSLRVELDEISDSLAREAASRVLGRELS